MINYRPLQMPSGLDDLNRWIGKQQFTLAAVMAPHVPEYFGVFSSHFEPRKLIHVSPWFGFPGLVQWPPPGDEAGVKATTFNTTEELGSACGAGLDVVTPHDKPEEFLGVPCGAGDLHQCIFICESSTSAAPNNCKAAPFVH